MKVVINRCYGGFGLSHKALLRYGEIAGISLTWKARYTRIGENQEIEPENAFLTSYYRGKEQTGQNGFFCSDLKRDDPALVQVVEEMGKEANGPFAQLAVVETPDDIQWEIEEYDGIEWVAEKHRTWGHGEE
mgnify:CR=1 FL=1